VPALILPRRFSGQPQTGRVALAPEWNRDIRSRVWVPSAFYDPTSANYSDNGWIGTVAGFGLGLDGEVASFTGSQRLRSQQVEGGSNQFDPPLMLVVRCMTTTVAAGERHAVSVGRFVRSADLCRVGQNGGNLFAQYRTQSGSTISSITGTGLAVAGQESTLVFRMGRSSQSNAFYFNGRLVGTSTMPATSTLGAELFCVGAGHPSDGVNPWTGDVSIAGFLIGDYTDDEAQSLSYDPEQMIRIEPRRVYFDLGAGGGAANLVIQDAAHGHTADAVAIASAHALIVADALHGHTADAADLSTLLELAINDALHGHAADNVALSTALALVVAFAVHAHSADSMGLSADLSLIVADAIHSHSADGVTLDSGSALAIADALHAHAADNLALSSAHGLIVSDALHGHTAESQTLSSAHALTIADALHGHIADALSLDMGASLTISDALHGHTAQSLVLTAALSLAIADAIHAHTADSLTASAVMSLVIDGALHAHIADNLDFSDPVIAVLSAARKRYANELTARRRPNLN
jgi:hypothetical protein